MTLEQIEALIAKHGTVTAESLRDLIVTVVLEAVEAERDAAVSDAERLNWLEQHCTGASDGERYLPFRIYWKHKGIRAAIDAAKGEK